MDPKKAKELDDLTKLLVDALDTKTTIKPDVETTIKPEPKPIMSPLSPQEDDNYNLGTCGKCGTEVKREANVVKGVHYHPDCFACDDCKKPLGTQKYFIIGGKKYCQNDKLKHLDKCKKCNQAIEENAIRTQEDDVYHADCFTCTQCGVVLHGKFFNVKDDKLCEDCFTKTREKCHRCSRPIYEASLRAMERIYHPECFKCSLCPKTLEGTQFFITDDTKEPVCKEDFERYVAKCCEGCKEPIVAERYLSLSNGENFHQKCYNERNEQLLR